MSAREVKNLLKVTKLICEKNRILISFLVLFPLWCTTLNHRGFGLRTSAPWIPTHESKGRADGEDSLWKPSTDIQQTELLMSYSQKKKNQSFSFYTSIINVYSIKGKEEIKYPKDRVRD